MILGSFILFCRKDQVRAAYLAARSSLPTSLLQFQFHPSTPRAKGQEPRDQKRGHPLGCCVKRQSVVVPNFFVRFFLSGGFSRCSRLEPVISSCDSGVAARRRRSVQSPIWF